MDNEMRIEIHCSYILVNIAICACLFVLIIWFCSLIHAFSLISLVLFSLSLGAFTAFAVVNETRPTVITADHTHLEYKHLLGIKTVQYTDIKEITCEPYVVSSRYGTHQRIRLSILTYDGDEHELNDAVNTNDILQDKLEAKETEIPLIRLYDFIKERALLP